MECKVIYFHEAERKKKRIRNCALSFRKREPRDVERREEMKKRKKKEIKGTMCTRQLLTLTVIFTYSNMY